MATPMNNSIEEITQKIKTARAHFTQVHTGRTNLAGILSGAYRAIGCDFEFPEPDIAHVYETMFNHRVGEPTVYRLSFGRELKWIGISHPWGLKPADIVVEEEAA